MPYDIVDAYEDIRNINAKLDAVIQILQEKKVLPIPKEDKKW